MNISKLEYVRLQVELVSGCEPYQPIKPEKIKAAIDSILALNGITVADEPEFFGSPFSEKEFKELMDAAGVPCGVKRDFLHLNLKKRGLVVP